MTGVVRRWDEQQRRFVYSAALGGFIAQYEQLPDGQWRAELKSRIDGRTVHLFEPDLLTPRSCTTVEEIHEVAAKWVSKQAVPRPLVGELYDPTGFKFTVYAVSDTHVVCVCPDCEPGIDPCAGSAGAGHVFSRELFHANFQGYGPFREEAA